MLGPCRLPSTVAVLSGLGACFAAHRITRWSHHDWQRPMTLWSSAGSGSGGGEADLVGGGGDVAVAHSRDGDGRPVERQHVPRGYVRLR